MDLDTVGELVNELLSAYDTALEYYTKWQRRKWQENHYRTHDKGKLSGSGSCGLSTSLSISGPVIRKTYTEGAETLGESFSIGNKTCRGVLHGNLKRLQEHIGTLYAAMTCDNGPLWLADILQASEAVRTSTVATLADQRKRMSVGRPTSLVHPAARRRRSRLLGVPSSLSAMMTSEESTTTEKGGNTDDDDDDDVRTVYRLSGSNRSPFQSEPPSPPPTPKLVPDDLKSTYTAASTSTSTSTTTSSAAASSNLRSSSSSGLQAKASVFSVFCPEALKYQIDVQKAMPSKSNGNRNSKGKCSSTSKERCRCGYDWYGWLAADDLNLVVKDGFRMTPRFLGKSHCEGGDSSGGGLFGCVLCTPSGRTETYADANALRDHINEVHTKWQVLRDSDMAGRLGGAMIS